MYKNRLTPRRYQPNPQQELFALLEPRQQKQLANILRDLKPRAQGRLCQKLLDYLDDGRMVMGDSFVVDSLAIFLMSPSEDQFLPKPNAVHPLPCRHYEPEEVIE